MTDNANDTSGPLTTPQPSANTTLLSQSTSGVVNFLAQPTRDLQEALREVSAFRLFWYDIALRPKARAHQTIIAMGILIALAEITSVIVMELEHEQPHVFLHYVIVERIISTVGQLIFSLKGTMVENGALLIIANLNAVGIVIRTAIKVMMYQVPNFVLLGVVTFATVVHFAATVSTFMGGLERFEVFMIGAEPHIIRMYREYRFFNALSFLDLELSFLVTATIFFFMDDYYKWYWIVAFVVLTFLVMAMKALMRTLIRVEASVKYFALAVTPFYLVLPLGVLFAMYDATFLGIHVDGDSRSIVEASIFTFLLGRVALLASASKCFSNFDNGMKEAFANERDAVEFVREKAARAEEYRKMFADLDIDYGTA